MATVLAPVRYPLSGDSIETLKRAIEIAEERGAELIILHVSLYQLGNRITRQDLKRAVEEAVGPQPNARYLIRSGFIVEEGILEEVADERADIVVIGTKHIPAWKRLIDRVRGRPEIAEYLHERVDAEIITV